MEKRIFIGLLVVCVAFPAQAAPLTKNRLPISALDNKLLASKVDLGVSVGVGIGGGENSTADESTSPECTPSTSTLPTGYTTSSSTSSEPPTVYTYPTYSGSSSYPSSS